MARDTVKGQRTVRTEEGRTFAIIRGRRWTRIPEYMTNGQLTARFFVDEATGEVRLADSWKAPKRWPIPAASAEFVLGLLKLPDYELPDELPEPEEKIAPQPYDGYMTKVECGWQVAAAGAIVAPCVEREEMARALLGEHGSGRPCWKVEADGRTERVG